MEKLTIKIVREKRTVVIHTQRNDEPVVQTTMGIKSAKSLQSMVPDIVREALETLNVEKVRRSKTNHEPDRDTQRTLSPF